jgi:hypothetical protein
LGHIFISYSRKDEDYAQRLTRKLRSEGLEVWIDQNSINYGENWEDRIYEGVINCEAFIVAMTPSSKKSKWVQREIAWADQANKPIFPLLLSGDSFPRFVLTHWVDVTDGNLPQADFFDDLKKLLVKQPPVQTPKTKLEKLDEKVIRTDGIYYRRFVDEDPYNDSGLVAVRYEYIRFYEEGHLIIVESTSPNLSDVTYSLNTQDAITDIVPFDLSKTHVRFEVVLTTYLARHSNNHLFVFISTRGEYSFQQYDVFEYFFFPD